MFTTMRSPTVQDYSLLTGNVIASLKIINAGEGGAKFAGGDSKMAKHIFSISLQSPTSVAQRGYLQPQTTWYAISISLASVKCLLLYTSIFVNLVLQSLMCSVVN